MTARPLLELRARLRRGLRDVFDRRGFVEVDTPVLSREVLPEAHIDPIEVRLDGADSPRFLQASPEALMKRLLAQDAGPIYQFAQSFRAGERGDLHDVEFCLLEWYAPGGTLGDVAGLVEEIAAVSLGTSGLDRVTCREAYMDHAGVDPLTADADELEAAAVRLGVALPPVACGTGADERRDRAFEILLAEVVQPRLGRGRPALLVDWPASQAAFARLDSAAPGVARRFELFAEGVELANGWEEETCRAVIEERIIAANRIREAAGRRVLPLPSRLLEAHGPAMPGGVGAALGFDRLVMLAAGAGSIAAVRPFSREA
ncbi:MAG: amino acid--tRNA ligase-related protein [Planctomycetaceae bacterium]